VTAVVFDEERSQWVTPDSALTMFSDTEAETFQGQWDRAGTVRGSCSRSRPPAHTIAAGEERLWPTPAASTPNDGEAPASWLARFVKHASSGTTATRAGVPLAIAARAPIVLRVARVGTLVAARELLAKHEQGDAVAGLSSEDVLNPVWVEMLMGFAPGWTDVDP
jgi:hypothetical protein